jgi:hypothetical protein
MRISIYFNSKTETFSLWKSLIEIVKGPFHFILKLIISTSKFGQLPLVKYWLKATLDEGPRSNEIEQFYWMKVINWTHDF